MSRSSTCTTCTRRSLLRGIGVGLAGALVGVAGCGGSDENVTPDARPVDALPGCMANELCLDISQPATSQLATVGGFVVVASSAGNLIVIRTSMTEVAALASTCTHQGTTVAYAPSTMELACPSHGARFSLTGSVVKGPATVPLQTYVATLAGTIVTIKLA